VIREFMREALSPNMLPWLSIGLALVLASELAKVLVRTRHGRDWRALSAALGDLFGRRVVDGPPV
jgi:hypothetical protein